MDEKEQADRLAAAEALFMISNRGEKPHIPVRSRPTRRGKKQKVVDYDDITASKKRFGGPFSPRSRSRSRSKSSDGAIPTNDRGRGKRGGLNKRGRGRGKKHTNAASGRIYESRVENSESDDDNVSNLTIDTEIPPKSKGPKPNDSIKPKAQRGRGKKRGGKSKVKSQSWTPNSQSRDFEESDDVPFSDQTSIVGLSGANISKSTPHAANTLRNATSAATQGMSSGNLPSLGLVSGFNKVSLASKPQTGSETAVLPSLNLSSLTEGNLPSVNLPSLPSEYPFLQLSSQPTPNLSSLGDVVVSQSMDVDPQAERDKILPLKKRKLHKADESVDTPTTVATDSPVDGLSVSDSEERYEAISPEPARPPFTVQAPPIITMQTLMEIKTALQADDDGDLPLHIAVVHENMRMVAKLISLMRIAGKHVDKFNKQQQTPLHLAIKLDFTEAVELLLKSGADVNAVDCSGSSAIHMAVQGRSTPILRLLLEKCPNVQLNNRNIEGLTPLHTAVDNGDLEQAELLLSHGAYIDVTDGKSGRTPLFRAAESNHKPMVELLLKRGANVDVPSYAGVTVSMAAQGRNLHGVLKLLGSVQDKFGVGLESSSASGISGKSLSSNPPPPPLLYVGYTPASKPSPLSSGIGQAVTAPISLPTSVNSSASSPLPAHYQPLEGEKKESEQLTYLVHPQSKVGRADMTSGGVMLERADAGSVTKVFHNVFMLTDEKKGRVHMESVSEPSSPDPRMDEDGDTKPGRKDKPKGRGLMSLPETIDISGEETSSRNESSGSQKISTLESKMAKSAAMVIRRVAVGSPKSHISPGMEGLHNVPSLYRGRVSNDGVIHLVPSSSVPLVLTPTTVPSSSSSSSGSRSGASRLSSTLAASSWKTPDQVTSSSSPILVPVLQSSLPSSKPSSPRLLPSSSSLPSSPKSGSTTGKDSAPTPLSSIQAKLYETLLRRSHSQPGNFTTSKDAGRASPSAASSSVMSKLLLAPVQSLPLSTSVSTAGVVSYRVIPSNSSGGALLEPLPLRRDASITVPPLRVPSIAHARKGTLVSPTSSPPGTPLNLSKPSPSRCQEVVEVSDNSTPTSPSGQSLETTDSGGKPFAEKPMKKIISIGMRRVSNSEKSSPPSSPSGVSNSSSGFQGQYEMYVMPSNKQSDEESESSKGAGATAKPVTLKTGSPRPSIVLDSATVENMAKGELYLSHFPHVSKCVRDLLSRQNLLQKSSVLVTTSASSVSPTPAELLARSLLPKYQPAGKVVPHPTSLVQNNIVGLSGAILSSIPASKVFSKPQETRNTLSDDNRSHFTQEDKKSQRSASQKDGSPKKPRKKGANKGQRGSQQLEGLGSSSAGHSVSLSGEPIPNLSKINSKTDEILKKFLVAKRQEGFASVKARVGGEWQSVETVKKEEEDEASQESPEDSNSLKTVGIFSGHVQKLKLGKSKVSTASSPNVHAPIAIPIPVCLIWTSLSSAPSLLSSLSTSAKVVMSPSSTVIVSSSTASKTSNQKTLVSGESVRLVTSDTSAKKSPLARTASSTDISEFSIEEKAAKSDSIMIEDADISEDEEPMEIDVSAESPSNSPTRVITDNSLDDSPAKPSVSNTPTNLSMPEVQIVVQSPTPPLPVEMNDPVSETDTSSKEVTKD